MATINAPCFSLSGFVLLSVPVFLGIGFAEGDLSSKFVDATSYQRLRIVILLVIFKVSHLVKQREAKESCFM